jgi:hypothetical protein|tara:strand:- start:22 stop:249 length:228 start_codon:yes stop_codon:yes gene_type:complete
MSTNKNAYEIRADILGQAQGLIQEKYNRAYQTWEMSAIRHPETGVIVSTKDAPAFPTTKEILECANELYSFVDSK